MSRLGIALTVFLTSNVLANDAFRSCKQAILSSDPYGTNAEIGKPSRISDDLQEFTFDWDGPSLQITAQDGVRSFATARCVYNKRDKTVVFLNIYADTVISKYKALVKKLSTASKDEAIVIAKSIGLTDGEIEWLRHYGNRNFYGQYFPDGTTVIGFYVGTKSEIERLDKLHVISIYPQGIDDNFLSVSTDFSSLLSQKLKGQP